VKLYNYILKVYPSVGKPRVDNPRSWLWFADKEALKREIVSDIRYFPGSKFLGYLEKEAKLEYEGILTDNKLEYEDYSLLLENENEIEDLSTILEPFKGCKIQIKILE
jgi:hypothetical protein